MFVVVDNVMMGVGGQNLVGLIQAKSIDLW